MIKQSPLTVLEFNGTTIRVCRSQSKNLKRDITHCFSFEARDFEKDGPRLIRREFKVRGLKPENVILSLPRYQVMSHFLRLPSQKEDEIKGMVDLHVSRVGVYGKNIEMIHDYKVVGFDRQGYALVSIFFIQKNRLEKYLGILQRSDIFPSRVTLNTQGLLNWYLLESSFSRDNTAQCIFLLNIDHGVFDFNVFAKGHVIFSRTFTVFKTKPSDDAQRLAKEVKVSFELFRRRTGPWFEWDDKLYCIGPSPECEMSTFKNSFFQKVIVIDPLKRLVTKSVTAPPAGPAHVSYASVLGLALKETKETINMMPVALNIQMQNKKKERSLFRWILSLAAGLLTVSFIICAGLNLKINELEIADKKLQELGPAEAALQTAKKLKFVEQRILKPHGLMDIFYGLYKDTPVSVFISKLVIEEDRSLSIEGFSADLASVFNYLQALKQSFRFKDVRLDYVDSKEKENIRFKITCSHKIP